MVVGDLPQEQMQTVAKLVYRQLTRLPDPCGLKATPTTWNFPGRRPGAYCTLREWRYSGPGSAAGEVRWWGRRSGLSKHAPLPRPSIPLPLHQFIRVNIMRPHIVDVLPAQQRQVMPVSFAQDFERPRHAVVSPPALTPNAMVRFMSAPLAPSAMAFGGGPSAPNDATIHQHFGLRATASTISGNSDGRGGAVELAANVIETTMASALC